MIRLFIQGLGLPALSLISSLLSLAVNKIIKIVNRIKLASAFGFKT